MLCSFWNKSARTRTAQALIVVVCPLQQLQASPRSLSLSSLPPHILDRVARDPSCWSLAPISLALVVVFVTTHLRGALLPPSLFPSHLPRSFSLPSLSWVAPSAPSVSSAAQCASPYRPLPYPPSAISPPLPSPKPCPARRAPGNVGGLLLPGRFCFGRSISASPLPSGWSMRLSSPPPQRLALTGLALP